MGTMKNISTLCLLVITKLDIINLKLFFSLATTFFLFPATLFAQSEWTQHTNNNGLIISYKLSDCDMEMGYDEQRILFKIENQSDSKALVIWQYEQYYNDVCRTCDDPNGEYRKEFCLVSGDVVQGKCSVFDTSGLMIFSEWVSQPNKAKLTKWNLGELTIQFPEKK
jgi:hypothetical protein